MERCQRCVTPVSYPSTVFNEKGVCNHCLDYENTYADWDASRQEREGKFDHLVSTAKKRSREYDAIVPLSGGKDSTYVLYLAAKKYNMKVLCYNYDNGFQSEVAKENIRAAVDAAGADLIVFKPNEKLLMKLYRHFLKHTGLFCPICMRGIYSGQFQIAKQYAVPLLLKGTSRRTEESLVPEIFQDGRLSFFKNVIGAFPIDEDIRPLCVDRTLKGKLYRALYLLSNGKMSLGTTEVQLPDYVDWDYDEIYTTIKNEMGWKELPDRDDHIDCLAEPVVQYFRKARCDALTPNTLKYSALIRAGLLEREKALQLVHEEMDYEVDKKHFDYFLNKLDISIEDLQASQTDNTRHLNYQREGTMMSAFQNIRKLISAGKKH